MIADLEGLRSTLQTAGHKRQQARQLHRQAMTELADTIPDAIDAGIPITEIARLSGVTRQTVYNILNDT